MSTVTPITIKDLPSPKGHFLLGHLPQFKGPEKHRVLERWVKECGDLFSINFVGKKFIVSARPELNEEIMRKRPDAFRRFKKIDEVMTEMGVVGVFNAEGDTWRRHRKPIAEALNLKKVRNYYPIIARKTGALLDKWEPYAKGNILVDVQRELMHYTVDVTTAIAFGYELDTINGKEDELQKKLELIFPAINERITAPFPIWRYYKRKRDKAVLESLEYIETIVHGFIKNARKRLEENPQLREKPSNFLETLLVEQSEDNRFDDKEIYGNVFSVLLAGEDTTSNSIAWALYYLAQNPGMVEKVREEANRVYLNEKIAPQAELLLQLPYANAVAQEAMRLRPVTPNLYLQAHEDIVVQGVLIEKGMTVLMQNQVAQISEKYFSNSDVFEPQRWLKGGCPMHQEHHPDVIKVFGGGARFCPGKHLAMHEMIAAISAICKRYDLSLGVPVEEVHERFAFTTFPENLWIQLEKA